MRKGTIKYWLGWVIAVLILLICLAIYITGAHEIFVKRILDAIDVIIKIREVGP